MKLKKNIFSYKSTRSPTIAYSYFKPSNVSNKVINSKTVVTPVLTRLSVDVSQISIRHAKVDDNGDYESIINSSLDLCLSHKANIDQSGKQLIRDIAWSMYSEGVVAVVPIDTENNIYTSDNNEIYSMRTARITSWHPGDIDVELYNDQTGTYETIMVPKKSVAIIENPMYEVMNGKNSTMQRLLQKLQLLDTIDEQNGSGKLNIIMQLPYITKRDERKNEAAKRTSDLENQMAKSRYGIGYIDSSERVIQLNRAADNNIYSQVEYLTKLFYSQLGMTQSILDGTADEQTIVNYEARNIIPALDAITDEMNIKFSPLYSISNSKILYMRDPFKLVPVSQLSEVADRFTRNEILSSNEVRVIIGKKPSKDPRADELINKNISSDNHPNNTKGTDQNEV